METATRSPNYLSRNLYVGSKNQKEFMANLKRVYKAVNKELAEEELNTLEKNGMINIQL